MKLNLRFFYSLEQNKQFFLQLHDLSLGGISDFNIKSATTLLEILAKNTTSINVLKFEDFDSDSEPLLFDAFIFIIKLQEQLRQFSIVSGNEFLSELHSIISALESQKQSLQDVAMEYCTCTEEFKVLKNCEESILIETLASFCPNITYLIIVSIEFSAQLVELIGNLQKLQFLTLWCNVYIQQDELEKLLTHFAKTLLPTLQYLDLMHSTLTPYIHSLLNNCHAPLKNLLIDRFENKETIKVLIEFCK
ncbi:hypothetical protein F8M41_024688 [Gigaspora margarita]|uniref:Uncharacterized protein n=1 Tax=Gigaspora margarita TaxID=4874 RepID=A0A8H4B0E2_GIGMA|nr:hypothetical protein F8M41_024688 [Gigaspora margarita]